MINRPLLKYLICTAIPLLILLSMTVTPLLTILYGQEIQIQTRPVDPRDVFRGDYVVLSYDINEIPLDKAPAAFGETEAWEKRRRTPLYVTLKAEGSFYVVDHATFEKPAEGLYLKGWYEHPVWKQNAVYQGDMQITAIQVTYNLDQFFIPENTGAALESLSRQGKLTARVKVWNGYAMLMDIRP